LIVSHLDPGYIGGLVDFQNMKIHLSNEECEAFKAGDERYLTQQMAHSPKVTVYKENDSELSGPPAQQLDLDFYVDTYLLPLFGQTKGHCDV
jgi:hypothetical protein